MKSSIRSSGNKNIIQKKSLEFTAAFLFESVLKTNK